MREADHRFHSQRPAAAAPRLEVIERQLAIGEYRNRELGLPNFCGFLDRKIYN